MRFAWGVYAAAIFVATGVYYLAPTSVHVSMYDAMGLSAAIAMVIGARWHRPEPEVAWLLLGFGVLSLAIGNVVFGSGQSVPSPADMFFLSGYPLLALGLAGLRSWTGVRRTGRTLGTATLIAAVVGVISWVVLVLPGQNPNQVTIATRLVAWSYPAMDVVLILLLVRAMRSIFRGPTALKLFGIGIVLMLIADTLYAVSNFGDAYSLGSFNDMFWLLSYAFFGGALLHPSVREDVLEWKPIQAIGAGGVAVKERTDVIREALAQDLRFGVVVTWTGRMLLALGFAAVCLGAKEQSAEMVILAGAYATMGLLMWFAGSRLAYS